jgi:hypothetical protein
MPASLERSVSRLRIALVVVALVAVAPWVAAGALYAKGLRLLPPPPDVLAEIAEAREVRMRALTVVDASGKVVARLGSDTVNGASLRLQAPTGKEIVYLGRHPAGGGNLTLKTDTAEQTVLLGDFGGNGGFVELGKSAQQIAVHVGAGEKPEPFFTLSNDAGKTFASLGTNQQGGGALFLARKDGSEVATISADEKGAGFATFCGADGRVGACVAIDAHGGGLRLFDLEERELLYAGATKGGSAIVKVKNFAGGPIAILGAHASGLGGCVALYDDGGEPLFFGGPAPLTGHGLAMVWAKQGPAVFQATLDEAARRGLVTLFDAEGKVVSRSPQGK